MPCEGHGALPDVLKEKIEKNVRKETWVGGPAEFKWYGSDDMYGAFGTILNKSDRVMKSFLEDFLI